MQNNVNLSIESDGHLKVLDGWRGLSILLVLCAHLLPLGPKSWRLNESAGVLGMVVFFILSGFLITSFLLKDQNVTSFLIRRFFRVIPLAWLYLVISLALSHATSSIWVAHILFFANIPPKNLLLLTDHMWSLCVEIQFYLGIAILVAIFKKRGLYILPYLCICFTVLRILQGVHSSSITYYRIDEILAGCSLALIYHGYPGGWLRTRLVSIPQWPCLLLLVVSCLTQGDWVNYLRPYFAAILIGASVMNSQTMLVKKLNNRFLFFLAGISYSLYVIHVFLAQVFFNSTNVVEKYAMRPMLFAVLFILAFISTNYFEKWFINYGRKLSLKIQKR